MSKLLILVALMCAVAYAQAATAGSVQLQYYKNAADCTDVQLNVTTAVTGTCEFNQAASSSSSYYFDSTNVYSVSFYGLNCSSSSIKSVTQLPLGCKKVGYSFAWITWGTSAALPFSGTFPPSGFQVQSTYLNVSASGAKATACSTGNGVVEILSASNAGYCNPRSPSKSITTPSSTQGFCNADGTVSGYVTFSDNTCTTSAAAVQAPVPTECTISGSVATAPAKCGSAAQFPSDIPTTSYTVYSNADCTSALPVTYFVGSTCFDSQKLVCGQVNGTDGYATYSYWAPSTISSSQADGSCNGDASVVHQVMGGTCVPFPAGQTSTYRKYSCSASGPGGAASTASVSVIATLIAAIAAVFAVRSL